MHWPRGKALGGSSSINYMIYIRGHRANYDGWRDLGNKGWGFQDVLPYFRRSENNVRGGDAFERDRANLWTSGVGGTVPVGEFAAGDSGGGARQLIGNVWEWTACQVQFWNQRGEVELTQPLKSLRGGAFDTYFETQATCQLASGDSPLARKHNIGFRCAIGMHDLIPNISDLLDDEPAAGEVSA